MGSKRRIAPYILAPFTLRHHARTLAAIPAGRLREPSQGRSDKGHMAGVTRDECAIVEPIWGRSSRLKLAMCATRRIAAGTSYVRNTKNNRLSSELTNKANLRINFERRKPRLRVQPLGPLCASHLRGRRTG